MSPSLSDRQPRPTVRRRLTRMAGPTTVDALGEESLARREVEGFIRACFHRAYGANVSSFLPLLMALRGDGGEVMAALGMRAAACAPLFLEQYLDVPVEQAIAGRLGGDVRRDGIIEVGNLAVAHPGGARWLITALTAFLHARGDQWVVFTAVPAVRNAFLQLGLNPVPLAPATADRLGPEAREWGTYYAGGPLVMVGRVEDGYQTLHAAVLLERTLHAMRRIWQASHVTGRMAA